MAYPWQLPEWDSLGEQDRQLLINDEFQNNNDFSSLEPNDKMLLRQSLVGNAPEQATPTPGQ